MLSENDYAAALQRFDHEGRQASQRGGLILCGFAAGLLIVSELVSRYADPALGGRVLSIRALTLVATAAVAWLLTRAAGARRARVLVLVQLVVLSAGIHCLAQLSGGQLSNQYDRLALVVLAPAILLSWNAVWSVAACGAVLAVYVLGSALTDGVRDAAFTANLSRLLAVCVVAVGANAIRERARWRACWEVHTLTAARDRAELQLLHLNEAFETRLHERTQTLQASEERFRAMFEAAPIGVVTVTAAGVLSQSNRAFAAMVGVLEDEVVGRPLAAWLAADDRGALEQALRRLDDGCETTLALDSCYVRPDGRVINTHAALSPLRDAAGRFVCALAMIEDVTDRLRASHDAYERQQRLAQALRAATMGGMVAELAHELNQPLSAIVNFANGTAARLRRSGGDAALTDAVEQIAAQGLRAGAVIRRVREVVRTGGTALEAVDLNAVVRDSTQLIEADAQRQRIPVQLQLDPAMPALTLDRLHVEQVLINLLRNALDAMQEAPSHDHQLCVLTRGRGEDGVEIHVRDTGVGVAGDATARIFDAFFTTKPRGLGMGLAISRSIVEGYGGRLWATGNVDRGMTFAFSLPSTPPS